MIPYCKRCGEAVELFDVLPNGGKYRHLVEVRLHGKGTCPLKGHVLYAFNDGPELNDVEWK